MSAVKKLLVVALVVVMLLTGIPVVMGVPMDCADCDLGMLATTMCVLAVLAAGAALVAVQLDSLLSRRRYAFLTRLIAGGLERPPRLA